MVYEKNQDKFRTLLRNKRNRLLDERREREEAWKNRRGRDIAVRGRGGANPCRHGGGCADARLG